MPMVDARLSLMPIILILTEAGAESAGTFLHVEVCMMMIISSLDASHVTPRIWHSTYVAVCVLTVE